MQTPGRHTQTPEQTYKKTPTQHPGRLAQTRLQTNANRRRRTAPDSAGHLRSQNPVACGLRPAGHRYRTAYAITSRADPPLGIAHSTACHKHHTPCIAPQQPPPKRCLHALPRPICTAYCTPAMPPTMPPLRRYHLTCGITAYRIAFMRRLYTITCVYTTQTMPQRHAATNIMRKHCSQTVHHLARYLLWALLPTLNCAWAALCTPHFAHLETLRHALLLLTQSNIQELVVEMHSNQTAMEKRVSKIEEKLAQLQMNLDTLPELIARSITQVNAQQRQDYADARTIASRPFSDFAGLRRSTNPRQRRPITQQYSLREVPIFDRGNNQENPDTEDNSSATLVQVSDYESVA
ncbi:hypothetical protein Btru_056476 [Bulinus truncatus]|nr:hypothetical protein Btru_056476 [Bulinus truncatus]